MAEVYATVSSKDLRVGKSVSIVGRVENTHESGFFINDGLSKIKIINVAKHLGGIIEIRGSVIANMQIECHSFTKYEDEDFNFETHRKVLELYKRFPELTAV